MFNPGNLKIQITKFIAIAIIGYLFAVNLIQSLNWDMMWDAEILSYSGWLISEGLIPYRDIFEINMPGSLLVYSFIDRFLGTGDLMFRMFDLAVLFLIDILVVLYCKRYGVLTGVLAAGLFSCFHLSAGAFQAGQRDYLQVLFLLAGALFCDFAFKKDRCSLWLYFSGLCIGASTTIKPITGIFFIAIGVIACMRMSGAKKRISLPLGAFFAGGCSVPLCIGYWLWINDGLIPFLDILFNYDLKFYSKSSFKPFFESLKINSYFGIPSLYISTFLLLSSIIYHIKKKSCSPQITIVLLGIAYGIFHLLFQR